MVIKTPSVCSHCNHDSFSVTQYWNDEHADCGPDDWRYTIIFTCKNCSTDVVEVVTKMNDAVELITHLSDKTI